MKKMVILRFWGTPKRGTGGRLTSMALFALLSRLDLYFLQLYALHVGNVITFDETPLYGFG